MLAEAARWVDPGGRRCWDYREPWFLHENSPPNVLLHFVRLKAPGRSRSPLRLIFQHPPATPLFGMIPPLLACVVGYCSPPSVTSINSMLRGRTLFLSLSVLVESDANGAVEATVSFWVGTGIGSIGLLALLNRLCISSRQISSMLALSRVVVARKSPALWHTKSAGLGSNVDQEASSARSVLRPRSL